MRILNLPLACDQKIQVGILQVEALAEVEIGQRAFEQIDAAAQMDLVPDEVFESAFFSRFEQ